jgi:Immunoglobulin I-set domain
LPAISAITLGHLRSIIYSETPIQITLIDYICVVPPSIADAPSEYTVPQGESVRLLCEAHGDPKPQITWTKNGMRVSEVDPHYFIDDAGNLEIYTVDQLDSGIYSCTAVNVAGVKEKRLTLSIQSAFTSHYIIWFHLLKSSAAQLVKSAPKDWLSFK